MSDDANTTVADYTNGSQQNLMALVECLGRHVLDPQPIGALVNETGLSRDQVFRALWNARQAGWADETAAGWHLSPHLTQFSDRLRLTIAQAHRTYLTPEG